MTCNYTGYGALDDTAMKSTTESKKTAHHDSTYLVLGGTGGIGTALCRRLASLGARLVVVARIAERLNTLANDLDALAYPLDATDFDGVDTCFSAATQHHGRIDGIVCCIGSLLLKPAHTTTEVEWVDTISANLTSAFAAVRSGARCMRKHGGSIVLISSAAARIGLANHEAIAAAKAGVVGLTLSAAATYAPRNIRVNCVAPGLVRTGLTASLTENESSCRASTALHALGRIGEPEDVASVIEWLLSPEQHWVTGQVIGVDGGLGTVRSR